MEFPVQPRRKFLPRNRAARTFRFGFLPRDLTSYVRELTRENVTAKASFVSRSSSFDEFEADTRKGDVTCSRVSR